MIQKNDGTYITLRMSNNKKITAQKDNILLFNNWVEPYAPDIPGNKLLVNINHVLYIRPAKDEEIDHARIHGW